MIFRPGKDDNQNRPKDFQTILDLRNPECLTVRIIFYQKSLLNIGVKRDRMKWKYAMPQPKLKYKIKPI